MTVVDRLRRTLNNRSIAIGGVQPHWSIKNETIHRLYTGDTVIITLVRSSKKNGVEPIGEIEVRELRLASGKVSPDAPITYPKERQDGRLLTSCLNSADVTSLQCKIEPG